MTEPRRAIEQAEKDCFRRRRKNLCLAQCEQRLIKRRAFLHDYPVATYHIGSRARIVGECVNSNSVGTKLRRALYAAIGVSETGFGTKIRTGRHLPRKFARPFSLCNAYSAASPRGRGYIAARSSVRCHCVPSTPCIALYLNAAVTESVV